MRKLSKEQIANIATLRNAGQTNEEIGANYGIDRGTVAYWVKRLRAAGIEVKRFPRGGRKALDLTYLTKK